MAGMVLSTSVLQGLGIAVGAVTALWKPQVARFWGVPVTMVAMAALMG